MFFRYIRTVSVTLLFKELTIILTLKFPLIVFELRYEITLYEISFVYGSDHLDCKQLEPLLATPVFPLLSRNLSVIL